MPYWPPDSAPAEPPQMPGAPGPGPAPVPYGGPGWALAPSQLAPVPGVSPGIGAGADVLVGVTGADHVTESPLAAPDVNPYEPGPPQAIYTGQPGAGADDVAGSVAAAVAAAEARFTGRQSETYGQGSVIGDVMSFPASPLDPGAGPGETAPLGHFYDPDREY